MSFFTFFKIDHIYLFERLITPKLCYGSEVWGFNSGDTIERVHLQFLKKILRLKWNTAVMMYERANIRIT